MIRTTLFAGLALFLAAPALAGSPPVKVPTTPAEVDAACAAAGDSAARFTTGVLTGCRNTRTGGAIACTADGQCKDYFADPRDASIRAFIERNREQRTPL